MKGSPYQPQCGFSAKVAQIMFSYDVEFSYIDVLEFPEVRSTLPSISDFTYVNSECFDSYCKKIQSNIIPKVNINIKSFIVNIFRENKFEICYLIIKIDLNYLNIIE